jgi:hypothetical protein
MPPLQIVYAFLSLTGLLATWYFNLRFVQETGGFDIAEFSAAGYATSAGSSLSNDLLIGTLTFAIWSFVESRRLGMRYWWAWMVLTFGVAFACAFPLFLLFRDRELRRAEAARGRLQ